MSWRVIGEILRFMAVGAISTFVAIVLYNWLAYEPYGIWSPLDQHRTWSYIVSHAIGMLVSYELSRRWTFKDRSGNKAGEGFVSYAIINLITMSTIPLGCLWISRHWLGLTSQLDDNLSSNFVGLLLSQVARFYLFRAFVFKRPIRYTEVYEDPEKTIELRVEERPDLRPGSGPGRFPEVGVDRPEMRAELPE